MPVWIFEDKEMDVRPIRTKRDYHAALKEAEALWDSRPGSKESDRLEVRQLGDGWLAAATTGLPN